MGIDAIPIFRLALAIRKERYSLALALVERIEPKVSAQADTPTMLPLQYRALKGELLVRNGRFDDARRFLQSLLEEFPTEESDKAKYLRIYTQFWLAELRGDVASSNHYSRASLKLAEYASSMIQVPIRDSQLEGPFFDPQIEKEAKSAGQSVEEFIRSQATK